MARLALSRDLLNDFAKLEVPVKNRVSALAAQFQRMTVEDLRASKGIHLERHTGAKDKRARTLRISDGTRAIVFDAGDDETFIITRIGNHDETDRWMAKNEFRVNPEVGALEVYDSDAIQPYVDDAGPKAAETEALYAHRSDKEFTKLGVLPDLIPALRAFTNETQLEGLLAVLPENQANALILLTGDEGVDTLYAEVAGSFVPAAAITNDVVAALAAPASQGAFRVVDDEDELAEMLAMPLAQWRTFLHHSQRGLAYRDEYKGPVRVMGGAGTGKTVVAMHRVKALVDRLADRSGTPILFTTFTRNLAQAIERDLRYLDGNLLDVVEVINVDRLANRVVTEAEGRQPSILDDPLALWQDVVDEEGFDFKPEFLSQEWEQVILAQGCDSRASYFSAVRSGRGVRLDRRQRAEVWRAVEAFTQKAGDRRTYLQIAATAAGYLASRKVKPYEHVVVDEAQDLHEAQWRLLRAAVPEQSNDMFIVGDTHQRIYDRRASLGKLGIKIVGRSHRLRINYRTTYEILDWSLGLLGSEQFDDMDDGVDRHDFAGYHSFRHGPSPELHAFKSRKEQYEALALRIMEWAQAGVELESIAVATRSGYNTEALEAALRGHGIPVTHLGSELKTTDNVAVATMHRLKGLEYRCVAIVDADDDTIPMPKAVTDAAIDEAQHEADLRRERCLVYVACTRARDELWLGWSGKRSRFLST